MFDSTRIESVRIGRTDARAGRPGLLLVTDEATACVGQGFPPDALEWLKNCILAAITR